MKKTSTILVLIVLAGIYSCSKPSNTNNNNNGSGRNLMTVTVNGTTKTYDTYLGLEVVNNVHEMVLQANDTSNDQNNFTLTVTGGTNPGTFQYDSAHTVSWVSGLGYGGGSTHNVANNSFSPGNFTISFLSGNKASVTGTATLYGVDQSFNPITTSCSFSYTGPMVSQ